MNVENPIHNRKAKSLIRKQLDRIISWNTTLNLEPIPFQPALQYIQIKHRGQNALLTDLEIPRNCENIILYLLSPVVYGRKTVYIYPSSLYGGQILWAFAYGEQSVDIDLEDINT